MSTKQIVPSNAALTTSRRTPLIVLADVSLSMRDINGSGKSAWQDMKDALTAVLSRRDDYTLYAFSDDLTRCESPKTIPPPQMTTRLAPAIREAGKHEPETVLIITDGFPDDPANALDEAKNLGWAKIDVLFVGPNHRDAIDFCERLARNGGKVMTTRQAMLPAITLLLGNGEGGAINL